MKLLVLLVSLLPGVKADKSGAINIAESFTGNEKYWNPCLNGGCK